MLDQWEESVRDRRSHLTTVWGEPGVGKSHLVAQLGREVESRGGSVLLGRCFDEPRLPLQPWSDLLPDIVMTSPDARSEWMQSALPADVWEVTAHRLFAHVVDHFRHALRTGPVLMIAEDIHWAGVAALRLLDYVLGSCADERLLVVATVRSTTAGTTRPARGALSELSARVHAFDLHLRGLDPAHLREMLAGRGHHLSEHQTAAVWKRTAGVPLLAVDAVGGAGGVGVLEARTADLGDLATRVLEYVAVIGDTVPFAVLQSASGLTEDTLATALEELAAAGLVTVSTGGVVVVEMSHSLYRDAVRGHLSDPRQLVLSRRVLAAATALPQSVGPTTVSHHALIVARSGVPGDIVRAHEACWHAAEWATACHEHQEAARWLRAALDQAQRAGLDDTTVAEMELSSGLAHRRAGLPEARSAFTRAAQLARRTGDSRLLARVGLGWSRGFFAQAGQVDTFFLDVLRDALKQPGELPATLRARAMAALAAELTWAADGDERFDLAEQALDLSRTTGDNATLAFTLQCRHLTIAAADTLDIRRRDTEELLVLSEYVDDLGLRFAAYFHRSGPAIEDGDIPLIEDLLEKAGSIADSLRQPALQWNVDWSRASLLLWQGDLDAAEKLARESAELGVRAGHDGEASAFLRGQLIEIGRLRGQHDELAAVLSSIPLGVRDGYTVARYLCGIGRTDDARQRLQDVKLSGGRLDLRRDMLERPTLDNLAFLASRLGRTDLAAAVAARLEPLADTFGHGVVAHPVGHHWLGMLALALGRPDTAVAHLRRAVAYHESLGLPLLLAESWSELAQAYAARGNRRDADQARAAANDLAGRYAAAGLHTDSPY